MPKGAAEHDPHSQRTTIAMSTKSKTPTSYSFLNAAGYTAVTGEIPALCRGETERDLEKLRKQKKLPELAQRSRLAKAAMFLTDMGFKVAAHRSTIKRIVLQSADGIEAFATNKGEAIVGKKVERVFRNGLEA